ncbi:ly6/PLAUR domain-containing protein 6-like [Anoplophora glabripennis]|uniref:ly6/PLAUR domain-containing protein 6-like n=1 Tax=Anoplophora glabripennis TaxID=217634 RepID=UPI0008744C56|nr:ly6/PLAUR domain-containing protein 6-like [Anoplophora glabripennis]XP_018561733.1 ly6/PLAUR domain-containing protein 6-like [Anoplophora glabripennis]
MFRLSMLISCIFMTNTAMEEKNLAANYVDTTDFSDFDKYAVTCYICVNVSDNLICNQFAIDRPCKPGETFCHTLHIMDSKGTSVLVNKKCTTEKECQRNKVGCVEIDSQKMCVSCCDQNYCNVNVPTNSSTATFDDKISKMRMLAKNLFREREKALTTTIKDSTCANNFLDKYLFFICFLFTLFFIGDI